MPQRTVARGQYVSSAFMLAAPLGGLSPCYLTLPSPKAIIMPPEW